MSAARFKVGDRVRRDADAPIRTVVLSEPDSLGRIITTNEDGAYIAFSQDAYELVPQRYTVELRVPKAGERYVCVDEIRTAGHAEFERKRFVIVEDAS